MDFAAVGEDALAHGSDDAGQAVAADMGMRLVEHAVGGTEIMEQLHDPLHVTAFLAAAEEFTVGEGTGAAFAETVVALGVQPLVAVEQCDVSLALADFFAALEDDGFHAMLEQGQCREEPRGTCPHDIHHFFRPVHVLEMRGFVERHGGIFRYALSLLIQQDG